MKRNKIEQVMDVLTALSEKPLIYTHVFCRANINASDCKKLLNFLLDRSLVELRQPEKRRSKISLTHMPRKPYYVIADLGQTVLRSYRDLCYLFRELNEMETI